MTFLSCIRKFLFISTLFFISSVVFAELPAWQIVPAESSITFTATQNNAPVSGKFKTFTGDIHFDPTQLGASQVSITVDIASVSTSYAEVQDALKTPAWFNVKVFPQAVFKANSFTKTGDKTYEAKGTLTIRDKTQPVVLTFSLDDYSATNANVKGSTTLKRTQFGVGQGEWAATDGVKDDVKVDFVLKTVKK